MKVIAIDVSSSISSVSSYKDSISQVVSLLPHPLQIIFWNDKVVSNKIFKVKENFQFINFVSTGLTNPQSFIEILPRTKPFELYIFTDGQILSKDVESCRSILKQNKIEILKVHLYFLGSEIDLKFTDLFEGTTQEIYANGLYKARIDAEFCNFEKLDYDFIMKDDSLKMTILHYINTFKMDEIDLKNELRKLECRILNEKFENLSIECFYITDDIEGCVTHVRSKCLKSAFRDKRNFLKKMAEIYNLFSKKINPYSLYDFENSSIEKEKQSLDYECLTLDKLDEKSQITCISIKTCYDDFWSDEKILNNPFEILESDNLVQKINNLVLPHVIDYKKIFKLNNPDTVREALKRFYILHNDSLDVEAMIKHNNYVLSTLFQNKLPGNSVLWHIIFLYVLATNKLQSKKILLLQEIDFLGDQAKYFITLSPHLNPPIVETLNGCFWYMAEVCHRAFPNHKKNVLRSSPYISGAFLKFYTDVYPPFSYTFPKEWSKWQLWYTLCKGKKSIFEILSHYYSHEKVATKIILYEKPNDGFSLESIRNVKDIYTVYSKYLSQKNNFNLYENLDEKEDEKKYLSHVKINPKTCNPYVICKVTGKHWKECIGKYNVKKQSYVGLFKKYCSKYKKYPENGEDLMCFFNEYLFNLNGGIPELFPLCLRNDMSTVMDIFEEVRNLYTCKEYLKISNNHCTEEIRLKCE